MNYPFQDEIGLKEWAISLRSAHKCSQELLASMAKKAGKIYGTDGSKEGTAACRLPPPQPAPAPNGTN